MKPNKKAKWIIGVSGVAFSAFVLSQFATTDNVTADVSTQNQIEQQDQSPSFSSQDDQQFSIPNDRPFGTRHRTDGTTRRS